MNQSPSPSPGNMRAFTSCLLSFLLLVTPLAALATSMKSATNVADSRGAKSEPHREHNEVNNENSPHKSSKGLFNLFMAAASPVTASMADSFPDPNGDGLVDKGETITYTTTITNIQGSQLDNVEFQDTPDSNTSLVAGSIHASPVAFNDDYNWVGNTQLNTSARSLPSLTSNDVAPTDSLTLNTTPASGPSHGSVTISPNGHFVYTPTVGYTGDDSFTYTISNSLDNTLTSTGTVTIHMPVRVWYLQAGAAGDGRSNTPSGNPSAISTSANLSTDILYVFSNAGTLNGAFTLDNSQQLLGQGVNLVANSITLFTAGSTPVIANTGGDAVTLASGNTLSGFNIGNTSGKAIVGTSVGTLNVSNISINTTGAGLDLTGVSTPAVNVTLSGLTSSGGTNNVKLTGLNGTISLGSGSLSAASGDSFVVSGGAATISYSGSIASGSAHSINIGGMASGGSVAFSGGITDTDAGITLTNNTGATINFTGGLSLSTGANDAFTATGGGTVTATQNNTSIVNTLTTTTGQALKVQNTTIGGSGLTFRSITSNGGTNNGVTLDTTGAGPFTVTGNGTAASGGTIQNKNGSDNNATQGIGIYLNSVAGAVSLTRMDIEGCQNYGIRGVSVSGGLTLGNSTVGTTAKNGTTYAGTDLDSDTGVVGEGSLRFLNLTGTVVFSNDSFDNGHSRTIFIHNNAVGSTLNLSITNSTLRQSLNAGNGGDAGGNSTDALFLQGNNNATMNLTVTNSQITAYRQFGILTDARDTATMEIDIGNNTFSNNNSGNAGASCSLNFSGGSSLSTDIFVRYNVHNNTFRHGSAAGTPNNGGAHVVSGTVSGGGKFEGKVLNNTFGVTGVPFSGAGSGADVLRLFASGNKSATTRVTGTNETRYLVQGNTIQRYGEVGIQFNARQGNSVINATVIGNIIREPGTAAQGAFAAIWVNSGALASDTNIVNIAIGSSTNAADKNTMQDSDPSNATDVFLDSNTCAGCNSQINVFQNGSDAAGATIEAKVRDVLLDDNNATLNLNNGFTNNSTHLAVTPGLPPQVAMYSPETPGQREHLALDADAVDKTGASQSQVYFARAVKTRYQPAANESDQGVAGAGSQADDARANHGLTRFSSLGRHNAKGRAADSAALLPPVGSPVDVLIGSLPAGKVVKIKFQVTVNNSLSPAATTQVQTQGVVKVTGFADTPTDDPAAGGTTDPTVTQLGRSDLAVTSITDNATSTTPGSTLTYIVSYSNPGRAATGVVLTETVPAGTTFNAGASSAGWSCTPDNNAGSTCTINIGSLSHSAAATKNFAVTVNNPADAALNTISNTASIADDGSYEPDINAANNTATDTDTLNAAPAFTISKSDGVTATTPGSTLTYTLSYSNTGDQGATGVFLTDTLPAGTTFNAGASSAGWTETPGGSGVYKLSVGSLAGGGSGSGTATFVVNVNSPAAAGVGGIVNNASITDDGSNSPSAVTATASDTDTLDAAPDLALSKTPDVTNAAPGQTITYTLNYSNVGNQGAAGVKLTETVPANTTYNAAATPGWTCTPNNNAGSTCTKTVGALAGGGTNGSTTFAVTVANSLPGGTTQITNVATIDDDHANGPDPNTANNTTGNVTTPVDTPPTLGNYSDTTLFVTEGTTVTPSAAPADDNAGFTVGVTISPNTYTGTISVDQTTGVVTVGSAAPAGTYTVTVTATDNINQQTQKSFQLIVNKSGTTTGLASSQNPSFINQDVTFTATVSSNTTVAGPPTGSVSFFDGASLICTSVPLNASGAATCQTSSLSAAGSPHSITATYNGDSLFATSTSSVLSQTVTPSLGLIINATGDAADANVGDGVCDTDTGTAGDQCTLRAAIQETNAVPSDDAITFSLPPNSTITLDGINGALPAIDGNLTITGPGANTLTIQRGNSASSDFRIFTINSGKSVYLSGLTISQGIAPSATPLGGGIYVFGSASLTLEASTVSGNTASGGGGIYSLGTLTIRNSLMTGNHAPGSEGGGGVNSEGGTLTIVNSTISGNTAATNGGGLFNRGTSTTFLTNVTISNNHADNNDDSSGSGGGIAQVSINPVFLHNTIVAGNFKGSGTSTSDDISGMMDASSSFNLIGTGGSGGLIDVSTDPAHVNLVGVSDARLAALADNGGPTKSHALLAGSPALDAGDDSVTGAPLDLMTDQRGAGFARQVDGPDTDTTAKVDIGAVEAQVSVEDISDRSILEDGSDSFTFNVGGAASITTVTATSSNTALVPNNAANIQVSGAGSSRTLSINPAANQSGTSTVTVTVNGTGGQTMTDTFLFTVNALNDAPSFTKGPNQTINEDAGAQSVDDWATNISAGPTNESSQMTSFNVINDNNALFSQQPAISATGTLSYTPAADAHGTAMVTVVLKDDGGTAGGGIDTSVSQTFNITVNSVNDAPSFTKGSDQTASGANPQTVSNWATNIKAGPPEENGQTLSFTVINNNNALFSAQPSIDSSGTLTYTPIFGVTGTATVTVELKDNGGVANGGQDTSIQQTFLINISPIGWTMTGDSGATEDESNPAKPAYTNFTASAIAGTPAGSYVLRYNITAVGNLNSTGSANTRLRVRFRDEGAGSRVVVAIIKSPITGGATTLGTVFDSDSFTSGSGFQTQEIVMPTLVFDFSQNTYWLEVTLIKTETSNQPGIGSVQINQQ